MSKAPNPSYVTLPDCQPPYPSLLDFLDRRFAKVGRDIWEVRLKNGGVTDDSGTEITLNTPYRPNMRLRYYREVEREPHIPFQEEILFQNEHLLVTCKPHFLPVTPAGPYVNECLLYRLKIRTGISDLVPIHRIDRETAGIVMFSVNKDTRGVYHELFSSGKIHKRYEAVATLPNDSARQEWMLQTRIVRGEPWFRVKHAEGEINAVSRIHLVEKQGRYGYFHLEPLTGKQHQLRLHLSLLGSQILHDRYYPELQPKSGDDYTRPLQLLAKELRFIDPISQKPMHFCSPRELSWKF